MLTVFIDTRYANNWYAINLSSMIKMSILNRKKDFNF